MLQQRRPTDCEYTGDDLSRDMNNHYHKPLKNSAIQIATYIITICILYWVVQRAGVHTILAELKKANLALIFYSFLLSLFFALLSGLKMKILVQMMGHKIGFFRCQSITFAAFPLNVVLPSKGGDLLKSWSLSNILPFSQGLGIVLLDRLIDLNVLCLMSVTGSILMGNMKLFLLSLSALLVSMSIIVFLNQSKFNSKRSFFYKLNEVGDATKKLLRSRRSSLFIITASAIVWGGSVFQIYLLYLAIGQNVPLKASMAAVPVALLVGMFPITVAGMGTRDIAIVKLFGGYADTTSNITIGILFSLLRYWAPALIGLPFISSLKPGKKRI